MAKPFDAASKQLIELDPLAWLHYLGLPGTQAEMMDADLSAITTSADRFVRVHEPSYLAHFELQSSYSADLDIRTLGYGTCWASVAIECASSALFFCCEKRPNGSGCRALSPMMKPGQTQLSLYFHYHVVRVWELEPEAMLTGPAGFSAVCAADASDAKRIAAGRAENGR